MIFILAGGAVLFIVLAIPGLVKLGASRSKSRILNADWLAEKDKFKIIARWGAQY